MHTFVRLPGSHRDSRVVDGPETAVVRVLDVLLDISHTGFSRCHIFVTKRPRRFAHHLGHRIATTIEVHTGVNTQDLKSFRGYLSRKSQAIGWIKLHLLEHPADGVVHPLLRRVAALI